MLGQQLEVLSYNTDTDARIAVDPIAFPRRYVDPLDVEVAAIVASQLAYGRVDLFRPALEQLFARADAVGGPAAWARAATVEGESEALDGFVYRLQRGDHLAILVSAIGHVLKEHGSVGSGFTAAPDADNAEAAMIGGITRLRDAAMRVSGATEFGELPRGVRFLLSHPGGGSACKRWCMLLRWMVRPDDGVDFGLWTGISPRQLVMPLDTHVARIARLVGLTSRRTDGWATSLDVTRALRAFDAEDPVRFDFALAHLGISGGCKGRYLARVCPSCELKPVCVAAR